MKLAIALIAAALAGCASPGAYTELRAAEASLDRHAGASSFVNVDLLETAGTTDAQRATEITTRKERAKACHSEFHQGFVALMNEAATWGADALDRALQRGQTLDSAYASCIRSFGLTGFPEFKVGDIYLRTVPFLRSYANAAARYAHASYAVDGQSSAAGLALAAGIGAAGRSAATYQPTPLPQPTIQQPIRCSSYRNGVYTNTTCQ